MKASAQKQLSEGIFVGMVVVKGFTISRQKLFVQNPLNFILKSDSF